MEGRYDLSIKIKNKISREIEYSIDSISDFEIIGKPIQYRDYETRNLGYINDILIWEEVK